jgi:DNA invertase Pin-like site-specific DNA recombinase
MNSARLRPAALARHLLRPADLGEMAYRGSHPSAQLVGSGGSQEIGSGATFRPRREELLRAVRVKEIDTIVVWRLDRRGRSLVDLVTTLQELVALKVGFVSLSEALDLTTPSGPAFTGILAVFAEFERDILRDRVKAGIAQARKDGRPHGRPTTVGRKVHEMKKLAKIRSEQIRDRQAAQRRAHVRPSFAGGNAN